MKISLPKNGENYVFQAKTGSTDELRSSRAPQKLRTVRAQLLTCTPSMCLVCGGGFGSKYASEKKRKTKKCVIFMDVPTPFITWQLMEAFHTRKGLSRAYALVKFMFFDEN